MAGVDQLDEIDHAAGGVVRLLEFTETYVGRPSSR